MVIQSMSVFVHELARGSADEFQAKVPQLLGKCISFSDFEGANAELLRSDLKIVKQRLLQLGDIKPEKVEEISKLLSRLKPSQAISAFSEKVVKLADIDFNQNVVENLRNRLHFTSRYPGWELSFSDELATELDDTLLEKLLTHDRGNLTVWKVDLSKYPKLGVRAPSLMLETYGSSSSLERGFLRAIESEKRFQDCKVVVGQKEFHLNARVLSYFSRYFERMFSSGMKEVTAAEVVLPEQDPETFRDLLDFLHGGSLSGNEWSVERLQKLLALASYLEMDVAIEACASTIFEILRKPPENINELDENDHWEAWKEAASLLMSELQHLKRSETRKLIRSFVLKPIKDELRRSWDKKKNDPVFATMLSELQTRLEKYLEVIPNDVKALTLLGKMHCVKTTQKPQDFEKGHACFSKAFKVDRLHLDALCHLALLHLANQKDCSEDLPALLYAFEEALQLKPPTTVAYLIYVTLLLKGGKNVPANPQKAKAFLEQFVFQTADALAAKRMTFKLVSIADLTGYLAFLYAHGIDGVSKDPEKAAQLLKKIRDCGADLSALGALFISRTQYSGPEWSLEHYLELLQREERNLFEFNSTFLQPLIAQAFTGLPPETSAELQTRLTNDYQNNLGLFTLLAPQEPNTLSLHRLNTL